FHMVDFENYSNEFKRQRGWCAARKRELFNRLLDIMDRRVRAFFGAGMYMKNPRKIPPTYGRGVTEAIGKATMQVRSWQAWGENPSSVHLVFAKQPELSYKRIGTWCDRLKLAIPELHGCTGREPIGVPPLQVADIIAYEYVRTEGNPILRYPIRSLYECMRAHNFFFTPFVLQA